MLDDSRDGHDLLEPDHAKLGAADNCSSGARGAGGAACGTGPTASERGRADEPDFEYRTAEGKPYYYNLATGQTVWTLPPAAVLVQQQLPLQSQQQQQQRRQQVQWRHVFDVSSRKPYYHNLFTDEVRWELPEGAILANM